MEEKDTILQATDDVAVETDLQLSELTGEMPAEALPEAETNEPSAPETVEQEQEQEGEVPSRPKAARVPQGLKTAGHVLLRILETVLVTVLLVVVALYGLMYVVAHGPSDTARSLFVQSVKGTSAVGFLADMYFSQEEIAQFMGADEEPVYQEMDTSLIQLPDKSEKPQEGQTPVADDWGLVDEDGDGIILERVHGQGYNGYMMVVLDPSRVIMGSVPSSFGTRGYTVAQMVEEFGAVAGTNAGGFHDPDGRGNGSIPDTLVVYDGKIYYEGNGIGQGFAGFDSNHILHVGNFTAAQIRQRDIQYGVCFGPVLIVNGQAVISDPLAGGLNPRTAIGQRSDGAVLLLVIDGRQQSSSGATFKDLVDVFLSYGAVNACNLDGGSSTMMWFQGDYINHCASVVGIRPVPTSFLVLPEGVSGNE